MESEYRILAHLHENEETTQRKISRRTGLSLGAVNLLIKKMARTGLVKIERLTPRTVRYILTPQGMKEKTKLTCQFVRNSYRQILSITAAVEELLQEKQNKETITQVIIYGPADEIEKILVTILHNQKLFPRIIRPEDNSFAPETGQLILTWRYEDTEQLSGSGQAINIMNLI